MTTYYNFSTTRYYNLDTDPAHVVSFYQCAYALLMAYPFGYLIKCSFGLAGSDPTRLVGEEGLNDLSPY
jgi:hypothetical protein